jgi:hypothetical protein
MSIIVDSSGLSVSNKESYIEDAWKKEKRKYVKLHLMADKKTGKIVGFRVTSEKTGDSKKFVPLVKEVSKKRKVAKAYADTAYDARKNFNALDDLDRARDKAQEERSNKVARLSPEERGGGAGEEAGVRGMEGAQGLREEMDGGDRILIVQARAGRHATIKEVPQPEGRGIAQGHALQQVPVRKTVE